MHSAINAFLQNLFPQYTDERPSNVPTVVVVVVIVYRGGRTDEQAWKYNKPTACDSSRLKCCTIIPSGCKVSAVHPFSQLQVQKVQFGVSSITK